MPRPLPLLLVLAFVGLAGSAGAPLAPLAPAQQSDPFARFEAWLARLREGRERIDERTLGRVRQSVSDLRLLWAVDPGRGREIAVLLLDLLGSTLSGYALGVEEPQASPELEARRLAAEALEAHADPELFDWIAREILPLAHSVPLERRLAALWLLLPRRVESTKLALFGCARDPDRQIRMLALQALVGWEDETVHTLFLEALAQPTDRAHDAARGLAEEHFERVSLAPLGRVLPRLAEHVKRGLTDPDWRAASQAIALSRPLDNASIVPFLIEALSVWRARGQVGAQSLRIQYEIVRALERRSGRTLGSNPASWILWWQAVERGEVRGITPQTTGGAIPEGTRASFFGLRPTTDRVTFVIDRSGSMSEAFGVATGTSREPGYTRWDEASAQLLDFVEAIGEKARFNIVLFHDYAQAWRPKLVDASEANRRKAREWLTQHPGGATQLRAGIELALALQPDGSVDLTKLECDTVIVLCDGATTEGPGWVEAFHTRVNSIARVVFYCVQIGVVGDGTLEKLAGGSGGEFLRIDG